MKIAHWIAGLLLLLMLPVSLAHAQISGAGLSGENLLLIVNRNQPAGLELANYYARVRGVPEKQILVLEMPVGDDMGRVFYEQKVAAPIQKWFKDTPGSDKITCLVTFYGVPLRVGAQTIDAQTKEELAWLHRLLDLMEKRSGEAAALVDDFARDAGLNIPRVQVQGIGPAMARATRIEQSLIRALQSQKDPAKRQAVLEQANRLRQRSVDLALDCYVQSKTIPPTTGPATASSKSPTTAPAPAPAKPATLPVVPVLTPQEQEELMMQPRNAEARDKWRRAVAGQLGFFRLCQVVDDQLQWLTVEESSAALDSELAAVLWPDCPKYRWQINPLRTYTGRLPYYMTRTLMVSRLDGLDPKMVRRIIDDSTEIEKTGLTGPTVWDCRGLYPKTATGDSSYALFDDLMRNTMSLFHEKTTLPTIFDDKPGILVPGQAKGVALYCGWYSVRMYIPSCKFTKGAVAVHVASYEMLSLHDPKEKGWCINLLKDGVAATIGAVAEPYLGSFPHPDEFWPLLATGKLTLAESYWKSTPMVSWQQTLLGDPLYNPFKNRPILKVEDLSSSLQELIRSDSTGPNPEIRR